MGLSILVCTGLSLIALIGCTFIFFVELLDDVTSSAYIQPTGIAFFESTGGWDYRRIALIEPYQLVSIDKKTWSLSTTEKYNVTSTASVTGKYKLFRTLNDAKKLKFDVVDKKFIVIYASKTWLGEEWASEVWVVIIPAKNVEIAFINQVEFLTYLEQQGINQVNLTHPEVLYRELVKKGRLDWYP